MSDDERQFAICFRHESDGREPQYRYLRFETPEPLWLGGFTEAKKFDSREAAEEAASRLGEDWPESSRWLGTMSKPFVTTREEQVQS